jgi:regulator of replication initiation timing
VSELTAEIGSLRNENQRLKAELREIKLVLSKIQIDELRKFEKVNSWLRSFKKMI